MLPSSRERSRTLSATLHTTRRLALTGMFAGLAWGAGYADSIPNFEFLTVILFAGGWVLGPAWGALAGALAEFLYSAVNPYGSGLAVPVVLVSQVAGMALAGAAGGWLGRFAPRGGAARVALVVGAGVTITLVYDFITNLASGVAYGQLRALLVAGIPFALIHVATNAALFATVGVALTAALDRTRRSFLPPVLALFVAASCAALRGGAVDAWAAAEETSAAESGSARGTPRNSAAAPDSVRTAPRDSARADSSRWRAAAIPPAPRWGEGGAALLRRDDAESALALTREGGFGERFADERGSAEPLARFGLPAADVLVSWFGLPSATLGAVGAEIGRVPWNGVGAIEAPDLPVSAREAFRGEAGEARFVPWPFVARHPRVLVWAGTGSAGSGRSGFEAAAGNDAISGTLVVSSASAGALEPLQLEGDHAMAGSALWRPGAFTIEAAVRTARTSLEDAVGRTERRAGSAGSLAVGRPLAGLGAVTLEAERSDEDLTYTREALSFVDRRGRSDRVRLRVETPDPASEARAFAALTWGRERLASEGDVAFDRRRASLFWLAGGFERGRAERARVTAVLGAGRYHGGAWRVAPSLRVTRSLGPGSELWAGAARGLGAKLDARATDDGGSPLGEDPQAVRSSLWLGGVGIGVRSIAERAPRAPHGAWPRGSARARGALYAGEREAGEDPARRLFAGEAALDASAEPAGARTRFFALVGTGAWAPLTGLRVAAGGHALGRSVDAILLPSDPEWRAFTTIEGRHAWLFGDLDVRAGVNGEWIGPRAGTPAGNLPAASRIGVFAGVTIDDFDVRFEVRNVAGTNRLLPLLDDAGDPVRAEQSRFLIEARWTLWN